MERTLFTRRVLAAALTVAAAIAAHGGAALLADPRWAAFAGLAAVGVVAAGVLFARAVRACISAPAPPPLWITAALLLAAQTAAHLALLAGGVHSGSAQAGTLALHVALALLVALLLHSGDAWLGQRLRTLAALLTPALTPAPRGNGRTVGLRSIALQAAAAPRAPPAAA